MSISNLFQPNELTLFAGYVSIDQDFDANNGAYYQFHGTITTTGTTLITIPEILIPLINGKYILNLYVNANTTAGPQINGGLSQQLAFFINVVGGLLSSTSFTYVTDQRYIYPAAPTGTLTASITNDPVNQNVLIVNVQNSFAGNTTTWTVVGQLFGSSLHS